MQQQQITTTPITTVTKKILKISKKDNKKIICKSEEKNKILKTLFEIIQENPSQTYKFYKEQLLKKQVIIQKERTLKRDISYVKSKLQESENSKQLIEQRQKQKEETSKQQFTNGQIKNIINYLEKNQLQNLRRNKLINLINNNFLLKGQQEQTSFTRKTMEIFKQYYTLKDQTKRSQLKQQRNNNNDNNMNLYNDNYYRNNPIIIEEEGTEGQGNYMPPPCTQQQPPAAAARQPGEYDLEEIFSSEIESDSFTNFSNKIQYSSNCSIFNENEDTRDDSFSLIMNQNQIFLRNLKNNNNAKDTIFDEDEDDDEDQDIFSSDFSNSNASSSNSNSSSNNNNSNSNNNSASNSKQTISSNTNNNNIIMTNQLENEEANNPICKLEDIIFMDIQDFEEINKNMNSNPLQSEEDSSQQQQQSQQLSFQNSLPLSSQQQQQQQMKIQEIFKEEEDQCDLDILCIQNYTMQQCQATTTYNTTTTCQGTLSNQQEEYGWRKKDFHNGKFTLE